MDTLFEIYSVLKDGNYWLYKVYTYGLIIIDIILNKLNR